MRDLILQYLRVRRLLDEEISPRRRRRGEPRPRIGSPLYPQEALRDLALFINHRLVLTKDQRCRARVRAAKARVARQEAAAREKK